MLYVHFNEYTPAVVDDLSLIADDPAFQIDLWGVAGGPGTGEATFLVAPQISPGSNLLLALMASPTHVAVRGEHGSFSVQPARGWVLKDIGGGAAWDGDVLPPPVVDIVYDATNCEGMGFWADGGIENPVDLPRHVLLFHELAHAFDLATGLFNPDLPEGFAISAENEYRDYLGLPRRVMREGGCKVAEEKDPLDAWRLPTMFQGCFVATAAFGSPDAAEIQELRAIRDQIVLGTEWGRTDFAHFYETYARISPMIVGFLERDPRLRALVAQGVGPPLLLLARLFRHFPDDPIPSGEPWSGFLTWLRAELESLTSFIELPRTFADRTPEQRASEIAILLQFVLRSEARRAHYLDALHRDGTLPIRLPAEERERIVLHLCALGVRAPIVEQVIATGL